MIGDEDSFFRRTSAHGVAALALFRISGPAVRKFLRRTFRVEKDLLPGSLHYVRIRDENRTIDDAMLRIDSIDAPMTVTLTVHGSLAVDAALRRILLADGFSESADRPFFDDVVAHDAQIGPVLAAEIRSGLAAAKVSAAAEFFGEEASGRLARTVRGIARRVANTAATGNGAFVDSIRADIETLLDRAKFGVAFMTPPRVVVVGAVNAGKSTLFNALLGRQRAIVSDLPGTTRDVVESPWIVRGLAFTLVDTAGLRDSTNAVEREGIARAHSERQAADIVLAVRDACDADSAASASKDVSVTTTIHVVTKIDRLGGARRRGADSSHLVHVSAVEGIGLDRLENAVIAASPFRRPVDASFPCPFTGRQVNLLRDAKDALDHGRYDAAQSALERVCGRSNPQDAR